MLQVQGWGFKIKELGSVLIANTASSLVGTDWLSDDFFQLRVKKDVDSKFEAAKRQTLACKLQTPLGSLQNVSDTTTADPEDDLGDFYRDKEQAAWILYACSRSRVHVWTTP